MGPTAVTDRDRDMLAGTYGEGVRMAMHIVLQSARISGAPRLIDVSMAHIDSCLYHGRAGLDFAGKLAAGGARVAIPTTLNVGALDLLHPDLFRGDARTATNARRLMELYVAMGCEPTWTCAPYHLERRPAFGEHIAWAESNAIVFANSVLGARTDRYGDFIDICAAVTGRAPEAGLHVTSNRAGRVVFEVRDVPDKLRREDIFYATLGHLIGSRSGSLVPVIDGLGPPVSEDGLKALGAAASSSGAVGLFHVVGVTPEAPTRDEALQKRPPERVVPVTVSELARARDSLSTAPGGAPAAVSLGTPHFSVAEFECLAALIDGTPFHPDVKVYVSTGRHTLNRARAAGWAEAVESAGARIVTDTCTYITPIIQEVKGPVMTNSAKWAYYAPGNTGLQVIFGSMKECVRSAQQATVWRDADLWPEI